LFDKDIGELEFDWSFQLSILLGDTFSHCDPAPASTIFTYSTESSSDSGPSEYSDTGPPSDHSLPLGLNFQSIGVNSAYGGVDTIDGIIHPSPFPNGLTSFGSLPHSPSASPPLRTLSLPDQQAATPAVLPVQAASAIQPRSGPTRKYQCPKCGHGKTDSSEMFP
ncbi:hypothetical protein BJV78DRAFT_1321794, partial [Lactifluus subvellereus]